MKLSEAISKIINPHSGVPQPLTEANKELIAEYRRRRVEFEAEGYGLVFNNVIIKEGQCGVVNGGSVDYLLNTDPSKRYRVTVRTHWDQTAVGSGNYDQIHIIEAGGKQSLGCSQSDDIPIITYIRQVVGEIPIET